jgi:hypothetical protein
MGAVKPPARHVQQAAQQQVRTATHPEFLRSLKAVTVDRDYRPTGPRSVTSTRARAGWIAAVMVR